MGRKKNPINCKIYIHLPAYREPELVPTIEDAIAKADNPARLVFGICNQFNPEDEFNKDLDQYRDDPRFKIDDIPHEEAQGPPYARNRINEMLEDEEYILQLDAHHRFTEGWDTTLIEMHDSLKKDGVEKPILAGYLPCYTPGKPKETWDNVPWQQQLACFYSHGTIFIRPSLLEGWENMDKPAPSRFLSGHFSFADAHWAKTIKHDPDIYFSGEEINLTVRSFTHGYDFFHPHQVVIWHATMREEREGMLIWDDQHKRGEDWWSPQTKGRAKIRQLFGYEDNGFDLTGVDLGTERTLHDYELYAGLEFKTRRVTPYTMENKLPPNPEKTDEEWEAALIGSHYHLVNITREHLSATDYDSILVAYDDKNGNGIEYDRIEGPKLQEFLSDNNSYIHYEKFFLSERTPVTTVYWGHSPERGWAERQEIPFGK